ncbi:hypothetical protein AB0D04_06175 [Streptomyces sp. NPDC048483]|uniref:hypothetical protein n=1 Tax=Streptomyces sp. NPDC048483 TaxID=3154927 RepID=UPI003444C069
MPSLFFGTDAARFSGCCVGRKLIGVEAAFYAAWGIVLVTVFWAAVIVARLLDLSAPCTLAAAVSALAALAAEYVVRPAVTAIARRDGHG